jgi:hypothetical protein
MITETPTPKRPPTGRAVLHRKLRVDEVHRLDLRDLRRNGFFTAATGTIWSSRWWWGLADEPTSVVYYMRIDGDDGPAAVALIHPETAEDGWDDPIGYGVPLEWTPCHFGGVRPWFRCPLVVDGVPCRRRCRILFRPYNSRYFACRRCHRLSYRSRQVHRNVIYEGWDRAIAALDALNRARDPRASYRRKARAIRRAEQAEVALDALQRRLAG